MVFALIAKLGTFMVNLNLMINIEFLYFMKKNFWFNSKNNCDYLFNILIIYELINTKFLGKFKHLIVKSFKETLD